MTSKPPTDHPWRLSGVEVGETPLDSILKVFNYTPEPTIAQLTRAGGGEENYNTAIALLLQQGAIAPCCKHPTRYRLRGRSP
jgi:hypothetical protein